eukprot:gnl/TRDRNA2_/TRDRNA2_193390_c0_seq1.p1 gnl/TRDRNA2_/TRDRNA2_193390_c0~~gnl/TRDRNA2_/TRDRNA2_193390_c0_seq1.p1  ORF type:complete len:591 (-),score=96.35 gnl/TRDRNA2_/TRDRNA2_193390_c0_seq1:104-1876(-)
MGCFSFTHDVRRPRTESRATPLVQRLKEVVGDMLPQAMNKSLAASSQVAASKGSPKALEDIESEEDSQDSRGFSTNHVSNSPKKHRRSHEVPAHVNCRALYPFYQQFNLWDLKAFMKSREYLDNKFQFQGLALFLTILNALMSGIEADQITGQLLDERPIWFTFESLFNLFFLSEMLLKQQQLGWSYFVDTFNALDFTLVLFGVFDQLSSLRGDPHLLSKVWRTFRLLRLFTFLPKLDRFHHSFNTISTLAQIIVEAAQALFWVFLCVTVFCYALGICLVYAITEYRADQDAKGKIRHERWEDAELYGGTLSGAMYTVFEIFTLDSGIGRPFASLVSNWHYWLFPAGILVVTYATLNYVVPLFMLNVVSAQKARERRTRRYLRQAEEYIAKTFAEDFAKYSTDDGGLLDKEQFSLAIRSQQMKYKLLLMNMHVSEAETLFDLLDGDNSGTLSAEEFIGGILRLRDPMTNRDIFQLVCDCYAKKQLAYKNCARVKKLKAKIDVVQERVEDMVNQLKVAKREKHRPKRRSKEVKQDAKELGNLMSRWDTAKRVEFSMPQDFRTKGWWGQGPPPSPQDIATTEASRLAPECIN